MRAKELQTSTLEKQDILQFEIHLAAATNKATITESNSLLLAQLITNDPEGEFRRPPQSVLDSLAQANQHYKIGHLLCRSRNPDFLLDILQRQVSMIMVSSVMSFGIFSIFSRIIQIFLEIASPK